MRFLDSFWMFLGRYLSGVSGLKAHEKQRLRFYFVDITMRIII